MKPGASLSTVSYFSRHLFNSDNNIEFLLSYNETIGGTLEYTLLLVNEFGTVIDSINKAVSYAVREINGDWKLITSEYKTFGQFHPVVYTLPGTWTGIVNFKNDSNPVAEVDIYPNPVNQTANISYTIPGGNSKATFYLYNSNGIVLKTMTINEPSGIITIDRQSLPSGVYFYTLHVSGGTSITKQIVFQ